MLLTFLKYTDLVIAAASSVWGITTDVTKKVHRRKILTRGGYISISLTLLGFLISVGSTVVEDHQKSIEQENALRAEIRKTNRIILASQPLTSMTLFWEFHQVADSVVRVVTDGTRIADSLVGHEQGERGRSQNGGTYRENTLYPFLSSIVHRSMQTDSLPFLFLIGLDDTKNTVLPLGYLFQSVTFNGGPLDSLIARHQQLPAGIETDGGIDADFRGHGDAVNASPSIAVRRNTVSVSWDLDPLTFSHSICKEIASVHPTANLPDTLHILLIYNFKELPFPSTNLSYSSDYDVWTQNPADVKINEAPDTSSLDHRLVAHSLIRLTPNSLTDQTLTYRYLKAEGKHITDKDVGEAVACNAIILYFTSDRMIDLMASNHKQLNPMYTHSFPLTLLDSIPSMLDLEYWKSVLQNGFGCTIGSFLAIFVSYLIYMCQTKGGREEKRLQELQQNKDTLTYFRHSVNEIIRIVHQQIEELTKNISQLRGNSITVEPLTAVPLFELKRLADGNSVDRLLVTYIRQFPGEGSVKAFSGIMDATEYLYSQMMLLPEESKRAILYDYDRKKEYQQLFKEAYSLLGQYLTSVDLAHPTPPATQLIPILEAFGAHPHNNDDLAYYHQYFFAPVNDALVALLAAGERNPTLIQVAELTRDGKQVFAGIHGHNREFADSLEEMTPRLEGALSDLRQHARSLLAWT